MGQEQEWDGSFWSSLVGLNGTKGNNDDGRELKSWRAECLKIGNIWGVLLFNWCWQLHGSQSKANRKVSWWLTIFRVTTGIMMRLRILDFYYQGSNHTIAPEWYEYVMMPMLEQPGLSFIWIIRWRKGIIALVTKLRSVLVNLVMKFNPSNKIEASTAIDPSLLKLRLHRSLLVKYFRIEFTAVPLHSSFRARTWINDAIIKTASNSPR